MMLQNKGPHSRLVEAMSRLTWQWMKERVMNIIIGLRYTGGSFGSAVDGKRARRAGSSDRVSRCGPGFCSLAEVYIWDVMERDIPVNEGIFYQVSMLRACKRHHTILQYKM